MTAATVRSNAAENQRRREERDRLFAVWGLILERGESSKEEDLAVGGTEDELSWFFYARC